MLPNTPYFELLDHPENKIVYLFNDEIKRINNKPQLTSAKTKNSLKGNIAHGNKLKVKEKIEAPKKT
jgi:hypothetical protein